MYMYREKRGVSTFTGFVKRGAAIYYVGKNTRGPQKRGRLIRTDVQEDVDFFMKEMSQYDGFGGAK